LSLSFVILKVLSLSLVILSEAKDLCNRKMHRVLRFAKDDNSCSIGGAWHGREKNQHFWLLFDPLLHFATPPLQILTSGEFDYPATAGGCFPPLRESSQKGTELDRRSQGLCIQ
jgi:hypothetical protein